MPLDLHFAQSTRKVMNFENLLPYPYFQMKCKQKKRLYLKKSVLKLYQFIVSFQQKRYETDSRYFMETDTKMKQLLSKFLYVCDLWLNYKQ